MLTEISFHHRGERGLKYCLYKCDCGNLIVKRQYQVRNGNAKSCGCMKSVWCRQGATRHGHAAPGRTSGTYVSWRAMTQRCLDKGRKDYPRYGGAGIKVHDSWHKFENFLKDMGERPAGMSIERINNLGNYEPSNCRWATSRQQAANRRNTRMISFNGETKNLKEWSRCLGIKYVTLFPRISRYGWSIERAFSIEEVAV